MNLGYSGGNDEFDDSGVLSHVVITGAGQSRGYYDDALGQHIDVFSNGLTLLSVGQGTLVDTVQVDETSNGGASVHLSGGSVNAKRLVLTRQGSTMLSMDSGYSGNLQHVFVNQRDWSYLGSAIRISSDELDSRKTMPTLANLTVIGSRGEYHGGDEPPEPDTHIIGISGGAGVFLHNTAITLDPIAKSPIDACIEADEVSRLLAGSSLYYENIIRDCSTNDDDTGHLIIRDDGQPVSGLYYGTVFDIDRPTIGSTFGIQELASVLVEPTDWDAVVGNNELSTAQPDFLDPTDYIGAVDPLRGDDFAPWWSEWSVKCSAGIYDVDGRWFCEGIYDPRDRDSDGDGIADAYDAFPDDRSERYDTDLDGIGNNRDTDDDNDGVADQDDAFPLDVNETVDSDGDGVGDNGDAFPDDGSEWADSDGDGIGDNADVDADGNGYADCPVGTTEVDGNLCLVPSQVRTDLTLTYRASVDIQQPDYLMDSRVEVGNLGYIGRQRSFHSR